MKPTSTFLLLCSIATLVSLSFGQNMMANGTRLCTLECRLEKPDCPSGEAATGSEGCWGCCQPINPVTVKTVTTATTTTPTSDVCAQEICHLDPPRCQAGWQPKGVEGCWTRCCTQGSSTQTGPIGVPTTSVPGSATILTTSIATTGTTTTSATNTNTAPGSQNTPGGSMQLNVAGVMIFVPSFLLGVWAL